MAGVKRPRSPDLPHPCPTHVACAEEEIPQQPGSQSCFASPIVTLCVGPEAQVLTAHRSVLTRAEYFAVCLAPERFIEGQSNVIDLPEDDFEVITQILHYLYFGRLEHPLPGDEEHDRFFAMEEPTTLRDLYLDTYKTAEKLCMEKLSNLIADWFNRYFDRWFLTLRDIDKLVDGGSETSPLVQRALVALALECRNGEFVMKKQYPSLQDDFAQFPLPAFALAKVLALETKNGGLAPSAGGQRQWHINETILKGGKPTKVNKAKKAK